ncbi:MAG TPA: hypothetical protein VFZ98_01010 [Vicinamibacterales bacterium]
MRPPMRASVRSSTTAVLIFGVGAVLSACNSLGSTPTFSLPPSPITSGAQTVYTGTITDSVNGAGTVTVSVGNAGSSSGGTWIAAFSGQKSQTRFISGTLSGSAYRATVSDCLETDTEGCFPDCRQTFTGTLTNEGLTGTYAEVPGDTCTAHSGSINATRQ